MDGMLWGPGAEAELAYRRERLEELRGAGAGRAAHRAVRSGRPGGSGVVGGRAARHRRRGLASARAVAVRPAGAARGWALPGSGAWPAA